jgi:predicted RNA-binding Zn ribbon-like protein
VAVSPPAQVNKRSRGQGRSGEFPRLLAGRLCLDFANTIEGPMDPTPEDYLDDYGDLARWSWHAKAIDDRELQALVQLHEASPRRAAEVFVQARRLREAIDATFRAVATTGEPRGDDLRTVQQEYAAAIAAAALHHDGRRLRWSWRGVADLRLPIWLIAASAVELLNEGDLRRVKQCPGADDCGWLFYDASRNGTRRWCSMEGCGSRVKMRRHYARRRRLS